MFPPESVWYNTMSCCMLFKTEQHISRETGGKEMFGKRKRNRWQEDGFPEEEYPEEMIPEEGSGAFIFNSLT